jgi:hypothetical protein
MVVVDAVQLLSERRIAHPSRIVSSSIAAREFRLSVEGYPWWRSSVVGEEDKISFRFSGVTHGHLDLYALLHPEESEALEEFNISLTSTLDWAKPNRFSIYCSAPLLRPLTVYTIVENYIRASRAHRTPGDYLNGAAHLSQFIEIVTSAGYLLATGPESIRNLVVSELEAQSIPHTVVETKGRSEGRLFVRLEGSAFYCETAVAEFE